MKKIIKDWVWYVPGLLIGAASGYLYWKYFGCDGTCLITSSPLKSTIYFAVMGLFVNQMFKPSKKTGSSTN